MRLTSAIQILCDSRTLPASSRCLAEVIEQLALRAGARQRLEFVLAVDIDDQCADVAQQRERHRHAIEIAARAAIGGDDAAHRELVVGVDRLFGEQVAQRRRAVADVEGGGELGALRAGAHHFGAALAAGEQRQRVDDDGLARAGFAREHGEPRAHLELDQIDDGEVTNLQVGQHGSLGLVEAAATPMELGAQQAVVLEPVRMQQRDLARGGMHLETIARQQFAERHAIAGDLRAGVGPIDELDGDDRAARTRRWVGPTSVCGQMGATTSASRCGATMGPPQESAYAVEPVELATTRPSPPCEFT